MWGNLVDVIQNEFGFEIVMKLVKALPHENVNLHTDNIDLLEQLLSIQNVYVRRETINNMLKEDLKD